MEYNLKALYITKAEEQAHNKYKGFVCALTGVILA